MADNRETPRTVRTVSSGTAAAKGADARDHAGSEPRASGRVTPTSERIIRKISMKRRKAMQELADR